MQKDIRRTPLHREAEALVRALRQSGTELTSEAAEVSTNGTQAVFPGTLLDALSGMPPTRICLTDLADRHLLVAGHRGLETVVVRELPAATDYTARLVGWFEEHMSAGPSVSNAGKAAKAAA